MRNHFLFLTLASYLLPLFPLPTAESSHCGVVSYSYPSHQVSYQAFPVVQQIYVPYAVPVPLYSLGHASQVTGASLLYTQQTQTAVTAGAQLLQQGQYQQGGYQQGQYGQQLASGETSLQGLGQADKLDRIVLALERIAGQQGQAQMGQEPPHVLMLRQHCAACHSGPQSKGGHQMFDQQGQLSQWSPEMAGKIVDRISRETGDPQRMPPNRELAYQEHKAIMRGLVSQPPQQAQQPPRVAPQQPQVLPKTEQPPPE